MIDNVHVAKEFLLLIDKTGPVQEQYGMLDAAFRCLATANITHSEFVDEPSMVSFKDCSSMHGQVCLRPYGYYGDFEIIDRIYNNYISDRYPAWDAYFQAGSASKAVRGRKEYFLKNLRELASFERKRLEVLNIASGPGSELIDFFRDSESNHDHVHCVDADYNAIYFARIRCSHKNVSFEHRNAFHLKSNKTFDLIWCAGLFDYLNDKASRLLLKKMAAWKKPNGKIIFGNFNENNMQRPYMEFGGWSLYHRSDSDMHNLANSVFNNNLIKLEYEVNNVNTFCTIL